MKSKNKKIIKIAGLAMLVVLGLAAWGLIYLSSLLKDLPVLRQASNHQLAQSTKIYDRTGKVMLYEIHAEENRTVVSFEEIPDYAKQATIVIEDRDF